MDMPEHILCVRVQLFICCRSVTSVHSAYSVALLSCKL